MDERKLAKVAVSAATLTIDRPYTYIIPDALIGKAVPGVRVTVPFGKGNRRAEGVILSVCGESERSELKCIESVLDGEPVLSESQLKLALWMRERFFCTVYDAVRTILPAGMWFRDGERRVGDKTQKFVSLAVPAEDALAAAEQKRMRAPHQSSVLELLASLGEAPASELCGFTGAPMSSVTALQKQGLVSVEVREVFRRPVVYRDETADGPIKLNNEQNAVFKELLAMMKSGKADAALLYGVTGSGKTSVYINLVREAVGAGKTAIVLVPEIGLTPQFVSVFSSHFGESVAVLHSSLTMGERYDEWKRIRSGAVKVVIGTRSAVFAPIENLGIIVIDEEQEYTYKSENPPRYHAREVAKYRCVKDGALLLLGSATPSVDSMYHAQEGTYKLFCLEHRYNEKDLPDVVIADMREEIKNGNGGVISSVLAEELRKNIERGEQSILFLNRRGASSLVMCGECGYTYTCPNCSVSMTYHSIGHRLLCHYCGHSRPVPEHCPECGGTLKFVGAGTQKVEEELRELFPDAGIIRMDADTVSKTGSHERLLSKFKKEKIPILLGTQMVTKGLDFENVTLVGVLSADQAVYMNDYRAHERAFSLITQVVGRSGRGEKAGRAVIQTFTPSNEVIRLASKQDYMSFYEREIDMRRMVSSPPICDLLTLTVSGPDEAAVLRGCVRLRDMLQSREHGMTVLGPAPAGVVKVNNRYRYRLSVVSENNSRLREFIFRILREFSSDKESRGLAVFADTDPQE